MKTLVIIATVLTSWLFSFEDADHVQPEATAKSWQHVTVPHDWGIYGPFNRDNDLQNVTVWQNGETFPSIKTGRSGGLPYMGRAWYKTTIEVSDTSKVHTLLFDGAMSEAEVYVNGQKAIFWPYGYNAFYVAISPYVRIGKNEISVRLENREQSSRWYPGAGLYRNVHYYVQDKVHVPVWGTHITTPYVTKEKAWVRIRTTVEKAIGHQIRLVTLISKHHNGDVIDSMESTYDIRHELPLEQNFTMQSPELWSPEAPSLYDAQTLVYVDNQLTDSVTTTFGIRSVQIVPNIGFLLNGKVRKFKGVCLHHDLGPLGAAVNYDAIRRQLLILKDMGCDAIRTSHNMPAPELIKLCDELGFMVMCEPFDEWDWGKCENGYHRYFNEWAERDMVNMLHHFRNNPSIVMWSVGNEVPTQCSPDGYRVAKMLQDICHREDDTRPCTAGMDQVSCVLENGFASILDVVGLNYRTFRYEEAYAKTPQKLVLGSETASTVSSRGIYLLPATPDNTDSITNRNRPNGNSKTNQCTGYDLQYCPWSNLPDEDFRNMDDYAWTIGQFVWTGFDYLGEPSPYDTDAWPSHASYFGIIDLAGIPKDRYYLYRAEWNENEHTIHILPHWNWSKGDTIPVFAYTDANEGELFLNSKSLGKVRKLSKEESEIAANAGDPLALQRRYRLIWDAVPYEDGEIKVVTKYGSDRRHTAGKPHHIAVSKEHYSDNFFRVQIVDKDGNLCPTADNMLKFSVKGSGRFRAAANGDAANLDLFHLPQHHAFAGELTVITEGHGILTITGKGLIKQTINF